MERNKLGPEAGKEVDGVEVRIALRLRLDWGEGDILAVNLRSTVEIDAEHAGICCRGRKFGRNECCSWSRAINEWLGESRKI